MIQERAMSRAWAEIDEDALLHNYRLARSLCGDETAYICVVKGNAYGLGIPRVVRVLREAGAEWFAVATAEEALQTRQTAPDAHILLLGPAPESYLPALIRAGVSLTVGTLENGRQAAAAQALGMEASVHVKLDTGLHRLGFCAPEEALGLTAFSGLRFEGVYSHMALRDDGQSRAQAARFLAWTEELARGGLRAPMRHLLDSIALTRYPQWQMEGVRLGAFLYGNVPPEWARFGEGKNVVTFKTKVTRVALVPQGDGVGYDDTMLPRDTRVATLSVGYIDGYPRILSKKGAVLIRSKRAPVLGLVCMDQMMVVVTDIPEAAEGDTAVLLGGGISLQEYAAWGNLKRNECLGILSRRVPRVYLREGRIVHISAEMDFAGEEA